MIGKTTKNKIARKEKNELNISNSKRLARFESKSDIGLDYINDLLYYNYILPSGNKLSEVICRIYNNDINILRQFGYLYCSYDFLYILKYTRDVSIVRMMYKYYKRGDLYYLLSRYSIWHRKREPIYLYFNDMLLTPIQRMLYGGNYNYEILDFLLSEDLDYNNNGIYTYIYHYIKQKYDNRIIEIFAKYDKYLEHNKMIGNYDKNIVDYSQRLKIENIYNDEYNNVNNYLYLFPKEIFDYIIDLAYK